MPTLDPTLPDLNIVSDALCSVFSANKSECGKFTIIDREQNLYTSTSPSEIVTCELNDCRRFRLLLKYSSSRAGAKNGGASRGHRGGVTYEAEIYKHVLSLSDASTPKFYGAYALPDSDSICLVLEYLDRSVKASLMRGGVLQAAQWLAEFHASHATGGANASASCLKVYDSEYYRGWADLTLKYSESLHQRYPWLPALCAHFQELIPDLLAPPLTVIHGEFYPDNILIQDDTVYPVDWESTALAAGEIDLASLTEGWRPEFIEKCKNEYKRIRWTDKAPENFERKLEAARVYWHTRWLGESGGANALSPKASWRYAELRSGAERMGLI